LERILALLRAFFIVFIVILQKAVSTHRHTTFKNKNTIRAIYMTFLICYNLVGLYAYDS
jgi:uncharacterized membrane protein YozB (DUF420 family)